MFGKVRGWGGAKLQTVERGLSQEKRVGSWDAEMGKHSALGTSTKGQSPKGGTPQDTLHKSKEGQCLHRRVNERSLRDKAGRYLNSSSLK